MAKHVHKKDYDKIALKEAEKCKNNLIDISNPKIKRIFKQIYDKDTNAYVIASASRMKKYKK